MGNLSLAFTSAHAIHEKNLKLVDEDVVLICAGSHLQPVSLSELQNTGEISFVDLPENSELQEHDLECKITLASESIKSPLPPPTFSLFANLGLQHVFENHQDFTSYRAYWSSSQPRAPPVKA